MSETLNGFYCLTSGEQTPVKEDENRKLQEQEDKEFIQSFLTELTSDLKNKTEKSPPSFSDSVVVSNSVETTTTSHQNQEIYSINQENEEDFTGFGLEEVQPPSTLETTTDFADSQTETDLGITITPSII